MPYFPEQNRTDAATPMGENTIHLNWLILSLKVLRQRWNAILVYLGMLFVGLNIIVHYRRTKTEWDGMEY